MTLGVLAKLHLARLSLGCSFVSIYVLTTSPFAGVVFFPSFPLRRGSRDVDLLPLISQQFHRLSFSAKLLH